jgi:hypothetical protein
MSGRCETGSGFGRDEPPCPRPYVWLTAGAGPAIRSKSSSIAPAQGSDSPRFSRASRISRRLRTVVSGSHFSRISGLAFARAPRA